MSLTIDQLRLSPNARKAAVWIKARHPWVVFTSGRRDARDQARAMAENVVKYGPSWLRDTYKDRRMVSLLMNWTAENPESLNEQKLVAEGFYTLLMEFYSGNLTRFPHLRGDAFDLAWPRKLDGSFDEEAGEALCADIEACLPAELGLKTLLKREGKHHVIHLDFASSVDV